MNSEASQKSALIKCRKCGESLPSEAKHCGICGAPVTGGRIAFWLDIREADDGVTKEAINRAMARRHYVDRVVDGINVHSVGFEDTTSDRDEFLSQFGPVLRKNPLVTFPGGATFKYSLPAIDCYLTQYLRGALQKKCSPDSSLACDLAEPEGAAIMAMEPAKRREYGLQLLFRKGSASCPLWDASKVNSCWGVTPDDIESLRSGSVSRAPLPRAPRLTVRDVYILDSINRLTYVSRVAKTLDMPLPDNPLPNSVGKELWKVEVGGVPILDISPDGGLWGFAHGNTLSLFREDEHLFTHEAGGKVSFLRVSDAGAVAFMETGAYHRLGFTLLDPSGSVIRQGGRFPRGTAIESSARYGVTRSNLKETISLTVLEQDRKIWQWPHPRYANTSRWREQGISCWADLPAASYGEDGSVGLVYPRIEARVRSVSVDGNGNVALSYGWSDVVVYNRTLEPMMKAKLPLPVGATYGDYLRPVMISWQGMRVFALSRETGEWVWFRPAGMILRGRVENVNTRPFSDRGGNCLGVVTPNGVSLISASGNVVQVHMGGTPRAAAINVEARLLVVSDGKTIRGCQLD